MGLLNLYPDEYYCFIAHIKQENYVYIYICMILIKF